MLGFGGLVMWEHRSRRVTRTEEVTTRAGREADRHHPSTRANEWCRRIR